MDKQDILNTTAAALRVILGGPVKPKRIRYEDGQTNKSGAVQIELPADPADPKQVVEKLKALLAGRTDCTAVFITGVGMFRVSEAQGEGRVGAKIALVTGAAQGFGREIAQSLAAEGATVILADVNESGARAVAEDIAQTHGRDRAMGLAMNVTDESSIAAGIDQTVRTFGGLDILICNAGVLKAGSVKDQPIRDFEFVTSVNYTGYFLCVQKAASVMAVGHWADPAYTSDILQINSKSGLVGSNRNGAYAGSKFGGIGLTQSFALELVEDGIKVNSICPGNFFDGPLWSDPKTGLFVQYLNTGKVPGAKTLQDVRRAYEARVPMKRGCTTADVMKAVFYLIEQQYETGQAVPVTGGQVMLS